MNGYELSRDWFDWCFENPEKINPNHTAIYFFAVEHCNRLGWREKFGFPTQMAMDAIGIKKHQTYIKYFNDLCEWGFFKLVQKSQNQYSANIISLQSAIPKKGKALDKAIINHGAKQTQTMGQSNSSIIKPINNKQINQETEINSLSYEDSNLIVSAINKTFNKQCKELTPAERYDFNERIKDGYKTKDFLLAIKNLAEEDWAIKKRYSYCTPKYIARLETLQQYCIVTEKEIPENESENDREVRLFLEQQEKLKNTPFKAPWQA